MELDAYLPAAHVRDPSAPQTRASEEANQMPRAFPRRRLLALIGLALMTGDAHAQAPAADLSGAAVSPVPSVVQELRRSFMQPPYNIVLFRSTENVFATRPVPRAGPVWTLPRQDHPLDFTYRFEGVTYTPEQFLDRTYANAMIVVKDGRIVFETYRNQSDARDRFIGFSMTKSITSILIVCALAEGRIKSLDDRIETYLPELKGGAYNGVTIRGIGRPGSRVSQAAGGSTTSPASPTRPGP